MKTIVIGDIHGRTIWKEIVKLHPDADKVIFIGDYFDSFNVPYPTQLSNFKDIIQYKKDNKDKVILLFGNHEYHYIVDSERYSGYQYLHDTDIRETLKENMNLFKMCHFENNILFSHAGVSNIFMIETYGKYEVVNIETLLNNSFTENIYTFRFTHNDMYGNSIKESPIWIRPRALISSNRPFTPLKKYIQVVGHTDIKQISQDILNTKKYHFVDMLSQGKYLLINNSEFNTQCQTYQVHQVAGLVL